MCYPYLGESRKLNHLLREIAGQNMTLRVTVTSHHDPGGAALVSSAPLVGVDGLRECRVSKVYHLDTDQELTNDQLELLCGEVLVDPVVEECSFHEHPIAYGRAVEVALKAGVTNTEARELERAAQQLGIAGLRVSCARRYDLIGDLDDEAVAVITRRLLANDTVEVAGEGTLPPVFAALAHPDLTVEAVLISDLGDSELAALSTSRLLSLDIAEMRAIQEHFCDVARNPTDAELETLAQTWSEHCMHKTFKAEIELTHVRADGRTTVTRCDGLLGALRDATDQLNPTWLRSAFVDDAGIVAFDDCFDLAFKVETHNHPSAIEPFGGANTGIGGVVRDILGVSARPIACTDVLCFGPADLIDEDLPVGVLHPRRIRDGVVAGIADYGNKLGLPTVNGAVIYDEGYIGNPLVFCGALGLARRGTHRVTPEVGDRVIVIGGKVGRDGIHGATFSSATMDSTTVDSIGAAVQIGDPVTEKGCIEVVERACEAGLYNAITDCGAGGLSSAVAEMGAKLGVEINLAGVPLKYPGLQPWEIWLSEAQERMVMAVPVESLAALRELCDDWDVELTDLGRFSGSGRLVVSHGDIQVIDMAMDFLHNGAPRQTLKATWTDPDVAKIKVPEVDNETLLALLAHPNVASKEGIVRRYDHEVRSGSVIRPLVGHNADAPSDAAVLKPLGTHSTPMAVVLSNGLCPEVGKHDPYAMALLAIDEAVRNLVAVGGNPDRVALLDNFCWGDPTKSDRLGSLVRAVQGCVDGSHRYAMPFISGKDSLFNEFDGQAIPGTLLISALGVVPDLDCAISSAGMCAGDDLWLVGQGSSALGGSVADDIYNLGANDVPQPLRDPLPRYRSVHRAIKAKLISAAHDCSDGGIAVAIAEMAIGARCGVTASVPADGLDSFSVLTNEGPGRLVLAAQSANRDSLAKLLGSHGRRIGEVTADTKITLRVSDNGREHRQGMMIDLEDALIAFAGEATK